jgi:thiol:disulfide interchange protein DsbD
MIMPLSGGLFDCLVVFLAGVVVSFTPCIYPVLPITVAFIAGVNTAGTKLSAFFLSLLYVLGIAVSYSALAVAAALTGKVFGSFQNNFWVALVVANFILLFALSMLDVIHLPMLQVRPGVSRGKGKRSIFVMGIVSGFVISPCTAPLLGTLLVQIAAKQDVFFGIVRIFFFALGLGTSLILAGTFSGFLASLPKSGVWLGIVKKITGVALLALAEYYLLRAGQLM